jgi:transposase
MANSMPGRVLLPAFMIRYLLPILEPGQILVMDKATFHKSEERRRCIAEIGCALLFLPHYSHDLNPIEQSWAHLKNTIKKIMAQCSSLAEAIDDVLKKIN